MFQIGESLKEARTRRGLTIADVQKELRLRERYLNALEEEHWDQLPGEAYVKGFLRMYAEFLGLNGNLYIDEYHSRFAYRDEEPLVPEPFAPLRPRSHGVLRTLVAVVVLGASVAGLAAWRLGGSPSSTATPPLQKPVVAKEAAPAPQKKPVVAKEAAPVVTPKAKHPVRATPRFAVITAPNGRCWLQVRAGGPHGQLLYQGTLAPGMTKRFSVLHAVWVRMGNPLALAITVAGKPVDGLPRSASNLLLTRRGAQSA